MAYGLTEAQIGQRLGFEVVDVYEYAFASISAATSIDVTTATSVGGGTSRRAVGGGGE